MLARYLKRCYDFEMEPLHQVPAGQMQQLLAMPSPCHYPEACKEALGLVRSGQAGHGVRELPLSGYDFASIYERDRDVLFAQLKKYGSCGAAPYAICARPEEAVSGLVYAGSQAACQSYWTEWKMKTMNKMCETITWMALESQADRNAMQEACLRTLDCWERCLFALDVYPMFDTIPPFNQLTRDVFEKYLQAKPIAKPQCYVVTVA